MSEPHKPKILICTQKVDADDAVLGFMHGWIKECATECESVIVIALFVGAHALPKNVTVLSLGKEDGSSKITRLFRFFSYIYTYRKSYDVVFVHMNQIYIILGAWFWRMAGKQVGLWYAHGAVSLSLRIAELLTHLVFTSTESGFRIVSKKKRVVGQGIDTALFSPKAGAGEAMGDEDACRIISIGRISPSKDYETLLSAAEILRKTHPDFSFTISIAGGALTESDNEYFSQLRKSVEEKGLQELVVFVGPVRNTEIITLLRASDVFASMGLTGSLDKTIVEASAAGVPVVTCNEAGSAVLGEYRDLLMYKARDAGALAEHLYGVASLPAEKRATMTDAIRRIVMREHSTSHLIRTILGGYTHT